MTQIKARQVKDIDKSFEEEEEYYTNLIEGDSGWVADWSGGFPNLCSGEWTLSYNGKRIDVPIPFQYEDANTLGTYYHAGFDGDWEETYDDYEDGLSEDKWIEDNIEYLMNITDDESQYPLIYEAFQLNDWRMFSCGGCL